MNLKEIKKNIFNIQKKCEKKIINGFNSKDTNLFNTVNFLTYNKT